MTFESWAETHILSDPNIFRETNIAGLTWEQTTVVLTQNVPPPPKMNLMGQLAVDQQLQTKAQQQVDDQNDKNDQSRDAYLAQQQTERAARLERERQEEARREAMRREREK